MSMTWWSEHSAVLRFVLASSAIRCRFVDRFAGSRVPSHVSVQRFSTHDAPLPSAGSRRARFPDIKGTMRALRLPARAFPLPYFVRSRGPRAPPSFVLAEALPTGLEEAVGPGTICRPAFPVPAFAPVDASGISQVPWQSVPCLCPDPRPRPGRRDLVIGGLADAAPGFPTAKAPAGRAYRG